VLVYECCNFPSTGGLVRIRGGDGRGFDGAHWSVIVLLAKEQVRL
jgi:hypothetical protein